MVRIDVQSLPIVMTNKSSIRSQNFTKRTIRMHATVLDNHREWRSYLPNASPKMTKPAKTSQVKVPVLGWKTGINSVYLRSNNVFLVEFFTLIYFRLLRFLISGPILKIKNQFRTQQAMFRLVQWVVSFPSSLSLVVC